MMNPKSVKYQAEIEVIQSRVEKLNKRLELLRKKKIEAENTEIIEMVRSVEMTPCELNQLIKSLQKNGFSNSKEEE